MQWSMCDQGHPDTQEQLVTCALCVIRVRLTPGADHCMTRCLRGVQGLIDAHEQFKATLGEADKEYTTIVSLSQEVLRLGQQYGLTPPDNPYTTLHAQVRTVNSLLGVEGRGG